LTNTADGFFDIFFGIGGLSRGRATREKAKYNE
jgi:hypothetical protein